MPYVEQIMKKNFIEYASYVIKERSIPHLDDGCKPVQRRVLHTLLKIDDGKFHKVANVTGECMKFHPHGDAPIFESLVNLANKELFIEKQGNFGNVLTGDPASAARYIECRISSLGKTLLYSPEITSYVETYDGRNKEPVTFPAKIPIGLVTGAEGIAVVMATSMFSHNFCEVIDALIKAIEGKPFKLYPDFFNGGLIDVSEYNDGKGKIKVRAKLDTSDPKKIVIKEIPFGVTTEKLMTSIEQASRSGKINIASIDDYTQHTVEIVLNLPRNVYTKDTVDALYAFTDCEVLLSSNPVVITNDTPELMSVSETISYYKERTPKLLKAELKIEEKKIEDKIYARNLERIFIEEEIYKEIEHCKTQKAIYEVIYKGFIPFKKELKRELENEDIERLLKIVIRRISAYDIEKYKKELEELSIQLRTIKKNIKNIIQYTISYLKNIIDTYGGQFPRKSTITSFQVVNEKDVAQRNLSFMYNKKTGYMGYDLHAGKKVAQVSHFDKVILFKSSGLWMVTNVDSKNFIGKDIISVGLLEKEKLEKTEFTVVYTNKEDTYTYVKRFKIERFLNNKTYPFVPPKAIIRSFTAKKSGTITLKYKPAPRIKKLVESFALESYLIKSVSSKGVRLSNKIVNTVSIV